MIQLGPWAKIRHLFATGSRPRVAGISGGRTSAMMASLLDDQAVLSFQNTGREAPRTYAFLEELEANLGREIVWLEYRPPRRRGAPPCESDFAVVTARTADRSGGPFEELLDALAAYRETLGKGPIAPWARSRICTSYLKSRTQDKWIRSLGWSAWDECVGLRADEPTRVARLAGQTTRRVNRLAPLAEAGIIKSDVHIFWASQSFDLGLQDYQGTCTGCFLKDQADLSRALSEPETEADWWIRMAEKFPGFGGKDHVPYPQLRDEAPARRAIEAALRAGETPDNTQGLEARRFRLVVIQERKRLAGQVKAFSCSCEGSNALAGMDEDAENDYVASLP